MAFKKGDAPWNKSISMREKSKKKLSEALKGKTPWNKGKKGTHFSSKTKFKKGHTPWHKGKKGIHSKETIIKMSKSQKMRFLKPEERKKLSEANLGRIHSNESKKKMSKAKLGVKRRPFTDETKIKISQANKGKPSPMKGKKTGKTSWNKGRPMSGEFKKKLSKLLKKTFANPEIRRKMSERQRKMMEDPKRREAVRIHTLKMYKSGKFPKQTHTKIEISLKEELVKRGYEERKDFIHQYLFNNKFMCDFCFPKQKVIIEADGDFWHANPKKYTDKTKLHAHQIKGMIRDKSKTAYIKKVDNGSWTLLRFWGSDIEEDVSMCVDKIEEVLKNKSK